VKIGLVACGLLGHSGFVTSFFGYVYCARCGETRGDTLLGTGVPGVVSIDRGHAPGCEKCRAARAGWTTWQRIVAVIEEPILRWRYARRWAWLDKVTQ
jgi:hypothetical protein